MSIALVSNYKKLLNNLPQIIEISGYKNEYIAMKLNIKPQYLSVKKQRKSWNVDDVEKLLNIIMNKDVQDYLDDLYESVLIEKYSTGKTISSEAFEKQMKW
jgi:hypothetical protein